jgi:hypothetical protein
MLALVHCVIRPVFKNKFCPPATKAFMLSSFTIYRLIASGLRPAAKNTGSAYFLSVFSTSASRIKFIPAKAGLANNRKIRKKQRALMYSANYSNIAYCWQAWYNALEVEFWSIVV